MKNIGKGKIISIILLISVILGTVIFRSFSKKKEILNINSKKINMIIKPLDFENGGFIPAIFTCEGEDLFPRFEIQTLPENTQSLAILVDDPDAPMERPFVHLIALDIPPTQIIDENTLTSGSLGINDFGKIDWNGPCPPVGHGIHHYHFKFFALENNVNIGSGFDLATFIETLENSSILGETEIIGLYERK